MNSVLSPNFFKIHKQKFQKYKIQNYILKTVIIIHAYLLFNKTEQYLSNY